MSRDTDTRLFFVASPKTRKLFMMSKPQTALIRKALRGEFKKNWKLTPAQFGLLLRACNGRIQVFENISFKHVTFAKDFLEGIDLDKIK